MKALYVAAVAVGLLGPTQDGKVELRYRFAAGDKFPMKIRQALSVKLDQVPEALQGILTAEPVDLKIEAALDMEVKEAGAEGSARLEGRWRRISAKGRLLVQDVDYVYDADGGAKARAPEAGPGGDPLQGLLHLEERWRSSCGSRCACPWTASGRCGSRAARAAAWRRSRRCSCRSTA